MTVYKSFKYYRIYFAFFSTTGLLFLVGLVTQLWIYFNTGADRATALNLPPTLPEAHRPLVRWLPDDLQTGRKMEDFNRREIIRDYLHGWYQQHLSYMLGDTKGLREYFTPLALPKVKITIQELHEKGFQLHQTDLTHSIKLHFYSADGQIVSFTDQNVLIKKRLYQQDSHKKIYSSTTVADYDVVMLLDDGYWRIKNWVRKPPSLALPLGIKKDNEGMVQVKGKRFYLKNEPFFPKGVNYYPQKTPWGAFWAQFDPKVIANDFALIRSLEFNTVRIFVNFHDFNEANVSPKRIEQMRLLLDIAHRQNLKVIVTLFDFLGDYRLLNFSATDRQLETLLTSFKTHPAIFAWDLKNEPDLDYKYHDKEDVQEWLQWMIERAKIYDPNHLLTIGWAYPENASYLHELLDFVSFHSYKSPEELARGIDTLQKRIVTKPLLLEEFGLSTYRGLWAPLGNSEDMQALYFSKIRAVLQEKGNIPFVVWTLYNFADVPTEVVGKAPWNRQPQKHFGILNEQGLPKKGLKELIK